MATSDEVYVDIVTQTKKAVKSMAKYAAAVTVAIVAVKVIMNSVGKLVQAYGRQEQAERKLTAAITSTGKQATISADHMFKFASSLQDLTGYGDEAIIEMAALLQQLADLDEKGLQKVIPAILDFAAAQGIDLQTATSLVGKTLGSSTNALTRYGVMVDMTGSKTEKLASLTEAMNEKFAGTAEALSETALGNLKLLGSYLGDIAENIGKKLVTFYEPFLTWLTGVARKARDATTELTFFNATVDEIMEQKAGGVSALRSFLEDEGLLTIEAIGKLLEKNKDNAETVASLHRILEELNAPKLAQRAADWLRTQEAYAKTTAGQMDAIRKDIEFFMTGDTEHPHVIEILKDLNAQLAALQPVAEGLGSAFEDMSKWADDWFRTEVTGLEVTNILLGKQIELYQILGEIAQDNADSQQKNTEQAEEWVGTLGALFGAIGESFIDMEKGVESAKEAIKDLVASQLIAQAKLWAAQAFAAFVPGPTFNPVAGVGLTAAAAAALVGAGLVQALGEGGIVNSPTLAVIGEKGPEAVIPLNKGMGGGVTVNFYGPVAGERAFEDIAYRVFAEVSS